MMFYFESHILSITLVSLDVIHNNNDGVGDHCATPLDWAVKILSDIKVVSGTGKVGDHWSVVTSPRPKCLDVTSGVRQCVASFSSKQSGEKWKLHLAVVKGDNYFTNSI